VPCVALRRAPDGLRRVTQNDYVRSNAPRVGAGNPAFVR